MFKLHFFLAAGQKQDVDSLLTTAQGCTMHDARLHHFRKVKIILRSVEAADVSMGFVLSQNKYH